MIVWMVGHGGFYNSGCEAIVRSTMHLIKQRFCPSRFVLWSDDHVNDANRLSGEESCTVLPASDEYRWRSRFGICRAVHRIRLARGGRFVPPLWKFLSVWPQCALSIGGDNFTLDYGMPERFLQTGEILHGAGIPFVIWGASIGPFSANRHVENRVAEFLKSVDLITVRENLTLEYLRSLRVSANVVRTYDPAFSLQTEMYRGPYSECLSGDDLVGLNLSALLAEWLPEGGLDALLSTASAFARDLIRSGWRIVLVPHVTRTGSKALAQNDHGILQMLMDRLRATPDRVFLLPPGLCAAELKWCISRCRFFIGARTHATIAAYSSGVPAIAIGYSIKAQGICRDLFGHQRHLLRIEEMTHSTLTEAWTVLQRDEEQIRLELREKEPEMQRGAARNVDALAELLSRRFPPGRCVDHEARGREGTIG